MAQLRSAEKTASTAAILCATTMIAQQVAGKATRDAIFLSNFDISALPWMLIGAAAASLGVVAYTSRALSRWGPGRVVPVAFMLSGVATMGEWGLALTAPKIAAVVIYLHIAVFGSVLISGFWSLTNERFDPRTAKKLIGRIGAGATLGGLLGGLIAERFAAYLDVTAMLPLLAVMHVFCGWRVTAVRPPDAPRRAIKAPLEAEDTDTDTDTDTGTGTGTDAGAHPAGAEPASGVWRALGLLARVPYLRDLGLLVLTGTMTAAFLDYVFKARAVESYTSGEALMRFFAVYYTGIGLVTFIVQMALGRRVLEKLGLGNTVALLPATVAVGGISAIFVPGLASVTVSRAAEAVVRSSLFRSGYELLYTPIPKEDKRATKTVIDVGGDRLGDALGGAAVSLLLLAGPEIGISGLLIATVVFSVVPIVVARRLQRGYVGALEKSLINRAIALDLDDVTDGTTRSTLLTMATMGQLDVKKALAEMGVTPTPIHRKERDPSPDSGSSGRGPPLDPLVARIRDVRTAEVQRVRSALKTAPLELPMVAHVVPLLAWDEVVRDAIEALRAVAPRAIGQLADTLLDADAEFAIRRRIPRVLCVCDDPRAVTALFDGLRDRRFEVRFNCGRALSYLLERAERATADPASVEAAVLRELTVDERIWQSQRLLDRIEDTLTGPFVDEVLRDRQNRSLEHVFTLLSLTLLKQPLKIAYQGLHTDDATLRGTALEYLESVLPPAIRVALWPRIEGRRRGPDDKRTQKEILAALLESHQSIELRLAVLQGRDTDPEQR